MERQGVLEGQTIGGLGYSIWIRLSNKHKTGDLRNNRRFFPHKSQVMVSIYYCALANKAQCLPRIRRKYHHRNNLTLLYNFSKGRSPKGSLNEMWKYVIREKHCCSRNKCFRSQSLDLNLYFVYWFAQWMLVLKLLPIPSAFWTKI